MSDTVKFLTDKTSLPWWLVLLAIASIGGWASLVAVAVALAGNPALPEVIATYSGHPS